MSDIKTTISSLCKHLNFMFDMKIKSEMFRLAKFNKTDNNIVEIFWTLLSKMINLSTTENVVLNIKCYFLSNLKYKGLQFYVLPEDMSFGSRELLLAFSYLLSQNYLDRHLKVFVNNSPFNPNYQPKIDDVRYNVENYSFNMKHIKTEEDLENALQWIEGKISCNKRVTWEHQNNFERLSAKMCKKNSVPNVEKLSISTILALNSVDHAKTFVKETEVVLKIVENHERWLRMQSVFWEWMNSVLIEKHKYAPVHIVDSEELEKFVLESK